MSCMSTDVMERLTNITLSGQDLLMTINIWLNDFLYVLYVLLLPFLHFPSYFLLLLVLFSLYFFLFLCFHILQDSLYASVYMLIHTEPRGFNKIALISLSLLSSLFCYCGIYQFATKPGRSHKRSLLRLIFNQQIETAFLSLVQPSKECSWDGTKKCLLTWQTLVLKPKHPSTDFYKWQSILGNICIKFLINPLMPTFTER